MFDFNLFYRKFEDKYRGSTDLIKDRLRFYLPFILPLKEVYPHNSVVDLGCGRGEWVKILADNGFFPIGVDTNDRMIGKKVRAGIVFKNGDALEFLKSLPDTSQSLITAFHLIEHVSFAYLTDLLIQAERVLLPGGLLILETPNPENFRVATESFYLDPSHVHPIPIQFISFLVDYIGIKRQIIVRLQEPANLLEGRITVGDLFVNVSPDYGIIAQKKALQEILDKFAVPFGQSYGVSFADLSKALDKQTREDFDKIDSVINEKIANVKLETKEQVNTSSTEMKELITNQFGTFSTELQNFIKQTQEDFDKIDSVINEKTANVKLETKEQVNTFSTEMKELITNQFGTFSTELQNFIKQTADQSLSNQIPRLIEHYTDISRKKALDEKTIDNQTQQIEALKSQMLELENQKHRLESEILEASKDKQVLKELITNQFGTFSTELQNFIKQTADQSLSNQIPRLIEHYTDISRKKTLDEKTIDNQTQQIEALKSQMLELENQKHRLESEILEASKDKQVLVDELMSVYSSKSFRLTRPLRAFARWLRKMGRKMFGINDSKRNQSAIQIDSGPPSGDDGLGFENKNVSVSVSDEKILGSELTEEAKYFYGILLELIGGNK